jgi:hypothetical protein
MKFVMCRNSAAFIVLFVLFGCGSQPISDFSQYRSATDVAVATIEGDSRSQLVSAQGIANAVHRDSRGLIMLDLESIPLHGAKFDANLGAYCRNAGGEFISVWNKRIAGVQTLESLRDMMPSGHGSFSGRSGTTDMYGRSFGWAEYACKRADNALFLARMIPVSREYVGGNVINQTRYMFAMIEATATGGYTQGEAAQHSDAVAQERERAAQQQRIVVQQKQEQTEQWRKSLAIGSDTNCGLIIELRPPLAKVQGLGASGEKWRRITDLFPVGERRCPLS